ncbi:hypothetical protein [Paraburkholderia caribensis]|uniref:hypothetical protein n=1 Tax=Paraburkholderia caribensis TaxID=75105 RepID=UPI000A46B0A9|nr:hypothetical protein [Paraburkholderia caribensis]
MLYEHELEDADIRLASWFMNIDPPTFVSTTSLQTLVPLHSADRNQAQADVLI